MTSPVTADTLIQRLRRMADMGQVGKFYHPLYGAAADEIDRLRAGIRAQSVPYPSKEAMMAAVELEIQAALGRVQTAAIGQMIQKAIDAALTSPESQS